MPISNRSALSYFRAPLRFHTTNAPHPSAIIAYVLAAKRMRSGQELWEVQYLDHVMYLFIRCQFRLYF